MKSNYEENLPIQIAMGWVMLLLILSISLIVLVVQGTIANDSFAVIRQDPGPMGLKLIVFLFAIYAVMPVFVYIANKADVKFLRWVIAVMGIIFLLFFVLHHISHWQYGDRPDLNSHALEMAHHIIGLWVIYLSVKWARSPDRETVLKTNQAPLDAVKS
jgi:hypothetical protein